jgi:Abnormal spindle-like microcephaly-assoc'd, ASPM-SPD-2-Hydin
VATISSDFTIDPASTCATGTTLNRDQTCTYLVKFAPTAPAGAKTGTLQIVHDGANSPQSVALSGTAVLPGVAEITLNVASLGFNTQAVNQPSAAQNIIVTNSGTAPLNISSVAIAPSAAGFSVTSNTCGAAVAPTGTCQLAVVFQPTTAGLKNATLTIVSNAGATPTRTVSLSGTGATAVIAITPASSVNNPIRLRTGVGGSTSQTVRITNNGVLALNVTTLTLNPPPPGRFTINAGNCNNLAQGAGCNVQVTFTPGAGTRGQLYNATLTVGSNAANGPQTVFLQGERK